MESTISRFIEITPGVCGGRPRIAGHRIRVQDIVLWTELGQSVDEIVAAYPQLSLSAVYAALAFYHDHRAEIDQQIRDDADYVAKSSAASSPGLLHRFQDGSDGHDSLSS